MVLYLIELTKIRGEKVVKLAILLLRYHRLYGSGSAKDGIG